MIEEKYCDELLICPFCKQPDFDYIGLKDHLSYFRCDAYEAVPTVEEEREIFRKYWTGVSE